MNRVALAGQSVLVVEDEPLVALDIIECLRAAGASVFTAHSLSDALRLAEHPDLSAAVVDFGLGDGDTGTVCERLNARDIPFVLYSGYQHMHEACLKGIQVSKPASSEELVGTVAGLLHGRHSLPACA